VGAETGACGVRQVGAASYGDRVREPNGGPMLPEGAKKKSQKKCSNSMSSILFGSEQANEDSESSDDDRVLQIRSKRRLQRRKHAQAHAFASAPAERDDSFFEGGLASPRATPRVVEDDMAAAAERALMWMSKAGRLRTPSQDNESE
jgi:hypothetical protein